MKKIVCPFCGAQADEADKQRILQRIMSSDMSKAEKIRYVGALERLSPSQLAESYEKNLREIYSEIGATLIQIDRQRQREAGLHKCQSAER